MARQKGYSKKIAHNKIIGQQGVNFVENIVLDMGFAWHPTNESIEAGIDGIIEIRDPESGEATNNIIQVQVKSTTKQWSSDTPSTFIYRCRPQDVNYWLNGNTPVVLIVVSPFQKEAYWVNVKAYFSDSKTTKEGKVIFQKATQKFTTASASELMKLAVPKDIGPYLPAPERRETIYSNLLKIKQFPQSIYTAFTDYRNHEEIYDWAKKNAIDLPAGWLLTDKMIRSVHNLRENPWTQLCDRGSVEEFGIDEWADSDDSDVQREFVRLINQVFRHDMRIRRLWYSSSQVCFYFPAILNDSKELKRRKYYYKSLLVQLP